MCQLWREYNIEFLPRTQIFGFLLFLSDFLLSSTCVLPINRSAPISALCPALLLLAFFSLFPHPSSCHHCFLFSLLLCLSSPFKSHQKKLSLSVCSDPATTHRGAQAESERYDGGPADNSRVLQPQPSQQRPVSLTHTYPLAPTRQPQLALLMHASLKYLNNLKCCKSCNTYTCS